MSLVQTQKAKQPGGAPARAFVRWGTLMKLLAPLISGGKISLEGIEAQEIGGGVHLRAKGGGGSTVDHPWRIRTSGSGYQLTPGSVNGLVPGNVTTTFSKNRYVWVKATLDANGAVTAVQMQSAAAPPNIPPSWFSAANPPTLAYYPVAYVDDDGVTYQMCSSNLSLTRNVVQIDCALSQYMIRWQENQNTY
jgi:hypothetical protein